MERSEWYAKLKEFHLCRDCKKQDAYTLAGHTRCYECAEKDRIRHACDRKDHDGLIKMRAASVRYKQKCISEGRCVHCGKFLGTGKRLCAICAEKQRQASKKSKGLPPRLPGIMCWQCNKKPCADGHQVCADCYEKKVKVALQNLERVDKENHPWRQRNRKLSPKSE